MNFLTVFSAYLVAGYLAAGKLGKVTLISLSVLYVIVTAMTATGSVLTLSAAIDIANEVATRAISNASNLSPVAAILAGTAGQVSLVLNPLVQLLACACAGSIAFVFRHRSSTLI
ncbi:MAG: hypothetical protein R3E82_03225 [Pseudomonadales bacterium]|nr:hypothetical protein [Pseudomonadales bacterium]